MTLTGTPIGTQQVYEEIARGRVQPITETKALLRQCQEQGWRTAIVQKGTRRRTKFELEELNLSGNFMVQA